MDVRWCWILFGDVIAECRELGEGMTVAVCSREKLEIAGGFRYRKARRPELYGEIIGRAHKAKLAITWMSKK
jgi:hypothetical protein